MHAHYNAFQVLVYEQNDSVARLQSIIKRYSMIIVSVENPSIKDDSELDSE